MQINKMSTVCATAITKMCTVGQILKEPTAYNHSSFFHPSVCLRTPKGYKLKKKTWSCSDPENRGHTSFIYSIQYKEAEPWGPATQEQFILNVLLTPTYIMDVPHMLWLNTAILFLQEINELEATSWLCQRDVLAGYIEGAVFAQNAFRKGKMRFCFIRPSLLDTLRIHYAPLCAFKLARLLSSSSQ